MIPGNNRGLTLLELLISIFLLSLIIFIMSNFRLFAYNRIVKLDRELKLQNEISYILEDMGKNIIRATGDINNPGIQIVSANRLWVRVDDNSPPTAGNYSDDTNITYYANVSSDYHFYKQVNATNTTLTIRGIITNFTASVLYNGTGASVYLQARQNPSQNHSAVNYQVQLFSQVYSRCASWN